MWPYSLFLYPVRLNLCIKGIESFVPIVASLTRDRYGNWEWQLEVVCKEKLILVDNFNLLSIVSNDATYARAPSPTGTRWDNMLRKWVFRLDVDWTEKRAYASLVHMLLAWLGSVSC